MEPVFVLDSSALLAYLYGEPGRDRVEDLLLRATEGRVDIRLHRINLGEIYYVLYRKGGEKIAEAMLSDVSGLPIRLEDRISPALMREAAKIKASYRVSYADAFAAGLAKVRAGTLASCDHTEFGPLESASEVPVLWVR